MASRSHPAVSQLPPSTDDGSSEQFLESCTEFHEFSYQVHILKFYYLLCIYILYILLICFSIRGLGGRNSYLWCVAQLCIYHYDTLGQRDLPVYIAHINLWSGIYLEPGHIYRYIPDHIPFDVKAALYIACMN